MGGVDIGTEWNLKKCGYVNNAYVDGVDIGTEWNLKSFAQLD